MAKILKPEIIELSAKSSLLREQLRKAYDVDRSTVWRWFKDNEPDGKLTTKTSLELISIYLNVPERAILMEYNHVKQK